MEGGGDDHHQSLSSGNHTNNGSSSSSSGSRWNPTKEQINMLESFYRQGLRTPSAEQIQQITARLRAYGHIEGKNVFYWFQNHKARQRQKQKQETINLAYFNRFLNPVPPAAFAPFPNATTVCPPYYTPPSNNDLSLFYHHHYPKVQPPAAATLTVDFNRRSPASSTQAEGYNKAMHHHRPIAEIDDRHHQSSVQKQTNNDHHHHQETLDLFPIHPTGVLNKKINTSVVEDYGNENKSCHCHDEEGSPLLGENDARYPFIDFFCRK